MKKPSAWENWVEGIVLFFEVLATIFEGLG